MTLKQGVRGGKSRKDRLKAVTSGLFALALLLVGYVLIDYSFNLAKPPEYRFSLPPLIVDQPVVVSEGNLMLIVARYSPELVKSLGPQGRLAGISQAFQGQQAPLSEDGYFVVKAYGTHIGCPLMIIEDGFKESCSDARYDFLGRSSRPERYADLAQIEYYLSRNHKALVIE